MEQNKDKDSKNEIEQSVDKKKSKKFGTFLGLGIGFFVVGFIFTIVGSVDYYIGLGMLIPGIILLLAAIAFLIVAITIKSRKIHQKYVADQSKKDIEFKDKTKKDGAIYSVIGARGRQLAVFDDKVIISVKVSLGSLLTHNATDGEKTIYYSDCTAIQYKKCSMTLGYLQFETPGAAMNNLQNNFFNENSFTWDTSTSPELMDEIATFVKKKLDEYKQKKNAPVVQQSSAADELKKYKSLLDSGIITQAEFDAKKKQLLGL